jgi:Domain of unknown function (DUF4276)
MVSHSVRKLFVEGGGHRNHALQTECRRGFNTLLKKAGFEGRMPRIVACGARASAYGQFRAALRGQKPGDLALLLVDSETAVTGASPWDHVRDRSGDRWDRPDGADDDQLHFMVQCMEAWLLADRDALRSFFGNGYSESSLPSKDRNIEAIGKGDLYRQLERATKGTKTRGAYGKGEHSFKLLARLDPSLVRKASPWAERLFSTLERLLPRDPA